MITQTKKLYITINLLNWDIYPWGVKDVHIEYYGKSYSHYKSEYGFLCFKVSRIYKYNNAR